MRVYYYTGGYTHTFYKAQASQPPAGVSYVGSSAELTAVSQLRQDFRVRERWWYAPLMRGKRRVAKWASRSGIVNGRFLKQSDCDLIHSAQYLLWTSQNWVLDFEDASVFTWYSPRGLSRRLARHLIAERMSVPQCRWILPWTEAARRSLMATVDCRDFASKIRVLYPAFPPQPWHPRPRSGDAPLQLLFVGTAFYEKGGYETLLACQRAAREINLHCTMVTYPPQEIRTRFGGSDFVSFESGVSPERLTDLYRNSDIFILPVHTDTLGLVYLEAMAHGLPCIGSTSFAVPEIIAHGQTGLTVDVGNSRFNAEGTALYEPDSVAPRHPFGERLRQPSAAAIDVLAAAILTLACNPDRRAAMGRAGWERIAEGRFSYGERNRSLGEYYRAALA